MADHNTLQHLFQSAKSDPSDQTLVKPSNWNKEHRFVGGAASSYLMWDVTQTDSVSFDNIWARMPIIDVTKPPYSIPNDGVTDASTPIANMLAVLGANGATLYFPAGTYLVNSNVNPLINIGDTNSNLSFIGSGAGKSILQQKGTAGLVLVSGAGNLTNILFRNLTFDGQGNAGVLAFVGTADRIFFEQCMFQNSLATAATLNSATTLTCAFRSCQFQTSAAVGGNSVAFTNAHGTVTLEDCRFPSSNYSQAVNTSLAGNTRLLGCVFGAGTWPNGCVAPAGGSTTEIGNVYDLTNMGSTNVWNWSADGPLTIINPVFLNVAASALGRVNTAGRDLRNLVLLGNPSAATTASNNTVPGVQTTAGLSNQAVGVNSRLNAQTSVAGIGNGANTNDLTAFTYTLPAAVLTTLNQGVRIEFSAHTAANGNNKRMRLQVAGVIILDTGSFAGNNVACGFYVNLYRTTSTQMMGAGYSWQGSSFSAATIGPFTVNGLGTLTNVINALIASPTSGAANDIIADTFSVSFYG